MSLPVAAKRRTRVVRAEFPRRQDIAAPLATEAQGDRPAHGESLASEVCPDQEVSAQTFSDQWKTRGERAKFENEKESGPVRDNPDTFSSEEDQGPRLPKTARKPLFDVDAPFLSTSEEESEVVSTQSFESNIDEEEVVYYHTDSYDESAFFPLSEPESSGEDIDLMDVETPDFSEDEEEIFAMSEDEEDDRDDYRDEVSASF